MIAHGYAFKEFCHEEGWLKPDCYRLKYTSEGVNVPRPIPHQAGWRAQGRRRVLTCARRVRFTPNTAHWAAHLSQHLAVGYEYRPSPRRR